MERTDACPEDETGHIADVRVRTHENGAGEQRARAHLKASPAFVAALRAEARAAAREELRSRGARRVIVHTPAVSSRHLRIRSNGSAEQLAAFVQVLRGTWAQGGPTAVATLLKSLPGHGHASQEAVLAAVAQGGAIELAPDARNGSPDHRSIQTAEGAGIPGLGVESTQAPAPAAPRTGIDTAPVTGTLPAATPTSPETPSGASTAPTGGVLGGSSGSPSGRLTGQGVTAGAQLPFTGLDVPLIALLGGASLAAGVFLRRLRRDGLR